MSLRDLYEERAAICEFDGGLSRAQAQVKAWHEVAAIWYREHGTKTPPDRCAGCDRSIGRAWEALQLPGDELAHPGNEYACVHAYAKRWKAQATVALRDLGIAA